MHPHTSPTHFLTDGRGQHILQRATDTSRFSLRSHIQPKNREQNFIHYFPFSNGNSCDDCPTSFVHPHTDTDADKKRHTRRYITYMLYHRIPFLCYWMCFNTNTHTLYHWCFLICEPISSYTYIHKYNIVYIFYNYYTNKYNYNTYFKR